MRVLFAVSLMNNDYAATHGPDGNDWEPLNKTLLGHFQHVINNNGCG